ncbi:SDR family oxidoreductase [Microvirga pudoricolor]|uniref:SDR family oxidoreductase n=1 Tax=Microvirga pudoricolor TaxID=2778729 RepID=UPI00195175EE|nr:SDR family oxidoreductase [Microvirga pudoricolor]MBM6596490.1 SDR family oxidoreductase [Microvirga pudoricolor]
MRNLKGQVVVITGASSGIGRAAARAFAGQGASVVLAARREDLLREVARECQRAGVRAVTVPTDVTVPEAVEELAQAALDAFGGVDVWINNAGTGVFGPFTDGALELHRRVIETNLLGTMHGCYSVLPVFLRQGHGVLINNISMGGWAPTPFAAAYTASKFGLRGFTASLRQELHDHRGIHICAVFPAIIDTPGFMHGANVSGRELEPSGSLYAPEDVARTFVNLVHRPRDEVAVGWTARAAQVAYAVAPGPVEHLMGLAFRRYLRRARPAPWTEGALLRPMPEGRGVSGGLRQGRARRTDGQGLSDFQRGTFGLVLAGALVATAAVAFQARRLSA